ncbi:glycosyltransferase family 61 protein [Chryseolinea sp. T2]|uniref:glycosyltransferase family 61 protein n=1 Tax=Chryseolinea sp. T2 TaxID=3129255 RepID=UPI0030784A58
MVKVLLKRIFPIAFLKKAFLVYNKLKISTFDKVCYREVVIDPSSFVYKTIHSPFAGELYSFDELKIRPEFPYLQFWRTWSEDQYILDFKSLCVIEPVHGWGIKGANGLVYQSLPYSRTDHQKKPDLLAYWNRRSVEKVGFAISFRDTGEENYFHFYNDILTKVKYLKDFGILLESVKIIVAERLWTKPYFQHMLASSKELSGLNWLIQSTQYIECERVIFCKAPTHSAGLLTDVFKPLNTSAPKGIRRIFVTRKRERLRFVDNIDEIERVCQLHHIEIIDAGDLTLPQQIELFSSAALIVGIHGAGLTNMMFRNGKCKVYEIFAPPDLGYLPFHYAMLAKLKGFEYRAIIGRQPSERFSGGFYVDADSFSSDLDDFINKKELK